MKYAQPKYNRKSTVDVSLILGLIEENLHLSENEVIDKKKVKRRVIVNETPVAVSSLRMQTFLKKGIICSCCGLEGTFFAIERMIKCEPDFPYHLNLYGHNEDGDEILFTHDHILARALGGKDVLENAQTMCSICNWTKGIDEGILAQRLNHK